MSAPGPLPSAHPGARSAQGSQVTAADFVLLHIGPWALALPRRAVRELLTPQDIDGQDGGPTLRWGDRTLPLLVLDDALQPVRAAPAARRICVLLESEEASFALLCDEFEHKIDVAEGDSMLHAVPSVMRAPRSPVTAVLRYGQEVAAVTDALSLFKAFESQLTLEAHAA